MARSDEDMPPANGYPDDILELWVCSFVGGSLLLADTAVDHAGAAKKTCRLRVLRSCP